MNPTQEQRKKYTETQDSFIELTGLKKGSKVKIVSNASDHQYGWNAVWNQCMNKYINDGKEYEVDYVNGSYGININTNGDMWSFPFFVLQVVESNEEVPLDSGDYKAIIENDGSITVGCQKIKYETLKLIYDKAHVKYMDANVPF